MPANDNKNIVYIFFCMNIDGKKVFGHNSRGSPLKEDDQKSETL